MFGSLLLYHSKTGFSESGLLKVHSVAFRTYCKLREAQGRCEKGQGHVVRTHILLRPPLLWWKHTVLLSIAQHQVHMAVKCHKSAQAQKTTHQMTAAQKTRPRSQAERKHRHCEQYSTRQKLPLPAHHLTAICDRHSHACGTFHAPFSTSAVHHCQGSRHNTERSKCLQDLLRTAERGGAHGSLYTEATCWSWRQTWRPTAPQRRVVLTVRAAPQTPATMLGATCKSGWDAAQLQSAVYSGSCKKQYIWKARKEYRLQETSSRRHRD